ncbi:MAG: sensor histidine kinase [Anaerolineaceae bacterium]|nr:sensor histidine kinase [Anaerolineaceae bacterium]
MVQNTNLNKTEQDLPLIDGDYPLVVPAELHDDELDRRRNQLWVGLWSVTALVLLFTFIARRITGEPINPLSLLIQLMLYGLVLANFIFLKTRHAQIVQGLYVLCIHLAVPPVLVLYGGTRGFGDIALFTAVIVAMLYGWRPWMLATFGAMAIALIWVLYRDGVGQPVAPLLDYSAQFTTLKFIVTMLVMVFFVRYINTFYKGLLDKYRRFAEKQVRLNGDLQASERTLATLNMNLKLSRQKIVTAREEERRRLRRDLHDGLGPTLAAQMFRIGVAQNTLAKDPAKTAVLLNDLERDIDQTLNDVRQLVYGLRPPLLDQFGLIGAIADFANQQAERIHIELSLPDRLPPLDAAVEVALFRIFQTALDNVLKHAHATICTIRLMAEPDALTLSIQDDGVGLPESLAEGVGLTAMRERAEELSGTFQVAPRQPQGTYLQVVIPLIEEANSKKGTQSHD